MTRPAPSRIYRCPDCGYITEYRWVLARHLYNVHDYYKKYIAQITMDNEYRLSPIYYRARDLQRRYREEED